MKPKNLFSTPNKYFTKGKEIFHDSHYREVQKITAKEASKTIKRTDILNYLLSLKKSDTCYLEVGVNNPDNNFVKIKASKKYGVEPGQMFIDNPHIEFKMTSDEFFDKLSKNEVLSNKIKFDVIFIDGMHLADQVDVDIENSVKYIKDDGFIVLHDCNPPTEWHARERDSYFHTPASRTWNGTTWKAFLKWRCNSEFNSCCIDTDWGIGILSKKNEIGKSLKLDNFFYEFHKLDTNRTEYLNLMNFDELKLILNKTKI